jgi:hypothetical protein
MMISFVVRVRREQDRRGGDFYKGALADRAVRNPDHHA